MMLLLIMLPVLVLAAFAHSLLQAYAPSNVLVRHARASRPTFLMAGALGALAFGCALGVQRIHLAIEAGASDWLNLFVLVFAWDGIKFAVMACITLLRRVVSSRRGFRLFKGLTA